MSVLAQQDDRVVCSSCRYSYPRIRGFCPGCGQLAPESPAGSPSPYLVELEQTQSSSRKSRMRSLGLVAVSLLVASGFFMAKVNSGRSLQPPTAVSATQSVSPEISPQTVSVSDSPRSTPQAQDVAAKATTARALPQNADQSTLWKHVKRGDINAEVSLAKTFLDESAGTQNCEQAHLLLLAASKNRNKEADALLSGAYALRCR